MSFIEDKIDIEEWKPDLLNLHIKSEPVDHENENISLKQEITDINFPISTRVVNNILDLPIKIKCTMHGETH